MNGQCRDTGTNGNKTQKFIFYDKTKLWGTWKKKKTIVSISYILEVLILHISIFERFYLFVVANIQCLHLIEIST